MSNASKEIKYCDSEAVEVSRLLQVEARLYGSKSASYFQEACIHSEKVIRICLFSIKSKVEVEVVCS
jgi:hypothetical protein